LRKREYENTTCQSECKQKIEEFFAVLGLLSKLAPRAEPRMISTELHAPELRV
jgi:hypothetical protein